MTRVEVREQRFLVNPYVEKVARRVGSPLVALGEELVAKIDLLTRTDFEGMVQGEGNNPVIQVNLFSKPTGLILERASSSRRVSPKLLFLRDPSSEARELTFKFVVEIPTCGIDTVEMIVIADHGEKRVKVLEFRHDIDREGAWLIRSRFELERGTIVRARQDVKPGVYKNFRGNVPLVFFFRALRGDGRLQDRPDYVIAPTVGNNTTLSRAVHMEFSLENIVQALERVATFKPAV